VAWRGRAPTGSAAAVLLALAAGLPGYFIGPSSAFAAVIALCLIATGVLVGDRRAALVYVALAAGQALACGLVLARVLPDLALLPVWAGDHTVWELAAAHGFVQLVYLAAFVAGRSLRRRYRDLVRQIEDATRAAARREALLEEARSEYRRALLVGRRGWFAGASGQLAGGDGAPAPRATARDGAALARLGSGTDRVDLATCLAAGRLDQDEVRALTVEVAAALEALHARGRVHLDVRPRTICRASSAQGGAWQLADAGPVEDALDPGSDPSALLAYAAPERLHGEHAGVAADVYGLAAAVYAAMTGCDPFDAGAAVLRAGGRPSPPRDPRQLGSVTAEVAAVLRIGLATAPADRFASASGLRDALLAALDGRLAAPVREAAAELELRDPWQTVAQAARAAPPATAPTVSEAPTAPAPIATAPASAATAPAVSEAPSPPSAGAWQSAYRAMELGFALSVTALCAAGGLFLVILADDRDLLHFAWACLAGIVVGAWWHWLRAGSRPGQVVVWPWVLASALSVGPAMTVGLHSGFAAIVAALVFAGGMFRGPVRYGDSDRRLLFLVALSASHTAAFTLIAAGLVDDGATMPVFAGDISLAQAGARHIVVLVLYSVAFAAGRVTDSRHVALSQEVEAAAREAARAEALLASAREELDRALAGDGGGLFSRLRLGDYQVGRLLGRGGVGEVYEAVHAGTGQVVALKLLRRDRAAEAWHARRLGSEASALRRVRSAHVARMVDGGDLDGEIPFVAMEFIRGTSLAALLRERPSIDRVTLAALVRDVAAGLADVHRAGVLHLDVKPGNLILGAAGWQLVDFGTAQLVDTGDDAPLVSGTPSYMSPEQALGAPLDPRSDLYSFALVLYRALVGRPAFALRSPAEVEAAATAGPPDPRTYAELSADLEIVLRIGLAARPADRFASAGELEAAFAAALDDRLPGPLRRRGAELLARAPWKAPPPAVRDAAVLLPGAPAPMMRP
jgi:serine/threonine protein kinase